MDSYPLHRIDNETFIALIEPIKEKLRISIEGTADSPILDVTLRAAQPLTEDLSFHILLNPAPGIPIHPPFTEVDALGTLLIQTVAAGINGGDFKDWCRYFLADPDDPDSRDCYAKTVEGDAFFRSVLGDEEVEHLIEESKMKGLV